MSQSPISAQASLSLREVTRDNLRAILNLKVRPDQEHFVAPNAASIAEAHFRPEAWFRAIYADEVPVGFVMLYDDPKNGTYFLWRFMIDGRYQAYGFGKRALELLIAYVKTRPGARELSLSYVPTEGNAGPFYRKLGFAETGKYLGTEVEMCLSLTPE